MLPRSDKRRRIHPDFPKDARRDIDVMMATSLARKGILAGETLGDIVKRLCPQIVEIAGRHGFELRFDLIENTHKALCKGRLAYQVRRPPLN
jgi:hypothetical protein